MKQLETFGAYLSEKLVIEKRFVRQRVAEFAPLADACDHFLVFSDRLSFVVVAVFDHALKSAKALTVSQEALVEMGRSALKYTGSTNGQRLPVVVHLIETGAPLDAALTARLEAYHRAPASELVMIVGTAIDAERDDAAGQFFTTLRWYQVGTTPSRGWLKALATSPRSAAVEPDETPAGDPSVTRPWVTQGALAALAVCFGVELLHARALSPTLDTLTALGGIETALVRQGGQWWRLATGPMLHGSVLHIVLNASCLWMVGNILERFVGRAWFIALYALGALGGALFSVALNPVGVVSIGASGAIMGLFASALVLSFKLAEGEARRSLQGALLRVLVPSLLPIVGAVTGQRVDYAAHFGGALTGALAGAMVYALWGPSQPKPGAPKLAAALAALGLAFCLYGGAAAVESARAGTGLIPDAELPANSSVADLMPRAEQLAERYPRDPRARFVRALQRSAQGDPSGAERDLRAALDNPQVLATHFADRRLEVAIRTTLAQLLQQRNAEAEARAAVLPVCDVRFNGQTPPALILSGLCP